MRQFRANVTGTISMIRHMMPIMRAQGRGTIVNVSSLGGRIAAPFACLYHASTFAIEGFSESFRYEAALHGIRVKVIEPGHFKTGFISRSLHRTAHAAYGRGPDASYKNGLGTPLIITCSESVTLCFAAEHKGFSCLPSLLLCL